MKGYEKFHREGPHAAPETPPSIPAYFIAEVRDAPPGYVVFQNSMTGEKVAVYPGTVELRVLKSRWHPSRVGIQLWEQIK